MTIYAALLVPPLLILSMLWTFRVFHRRWGSPLGYLMAFAVYWLVWCLLLPAIWLGGVPGLVALFRPAAGLSTLPWQTQLLLWWPVIFPLLFMFVPRARKANAAILLASLALGIVIGVTEEILWRGLYLRMFPGNLWLGLIYPSVMFGLWHLCPLSVVKNRLPGGAASFAGYAVVLGLTFGIVAVQTGSIFWPTIAHVVHDTLGLGGFAYAAWLQRPAAIAASPTRATRQGS